MTYFAYTAPISIMVIESQDPFISVSACKNGPEVEGYNPYFPMGHKDSNRIDCSGSIAENTDELIRVINRIEGKHRDAGCPHKLFIRLVRAQKKHVCFDTIQKALVDSDRATIAVSDPFSCGAGIAPVDIDYSNQGFVC